MDWLNYHHLQYFWTVVREGGITNACKVLNLTQPTISKQIKLLEEQVGEPLFKRVSKRLGSLRPAKWLMIMRMRSFPWAMNSWRVSSRSGP